MFNPLRPLRFVALVSVFFGLFACTIARQSRFVTSSDLLGMDKAAVSEKFGKPYKIGAEPEHEDWYYKENIFTDKWYEVTTILHFTNGKLTSIEPGRERPLHDDKVTVKPVAKD